MAFANPLDHCCPICKQMDQVQKVTAVAESNMYAEMHLIVGPGFGLTMKAAQLSAPLHPVRKPTWGGFSISAISVSFLCAIFMLGSSQPLFRVIAFLLLGTNW